jgi:hypothetical protein
VGGLIDERLMAWSPGAHDLDFGAMLAAMQANEIRTPKQRIHDFLGGQLLVVKMLATVAQHNLFCVSIPLKMGTKRLCLALLVSDLEVLHHLNRSAFVDECAQRLRPPIALDRF